MNSFHYHDLGKIKYEDALKIQTEKFDESVQKKRNGEIADNHLFFCEHNPVFTI